MEEHTIQISDPIYQLLLQRAASLNTTPQRLIERLLTVDTAQLLLDVEDATQSSSVTATYADNDDALASVHRLTTLFADVKIDDLEQALKA